VVASHPEAEASERDAASEPFIGRSLARKEDVPLLTGVSCFVDDLDRPGALHAAILRSPHASARITSIDASRALEDPRVADVLMSADLPHPLARIPMRMYSLPGMELMLQPPLADGWVRYSGEPVAVVLADSRYAAEDAFDRIDVVYEPEEPLLDPTAALDSVSPVLHPEAGSNLAGEIHIRWGDVDAAFAEADLVVRERLTCQRHGAVPLEPRGLVAEVEPRSGRLTVWGAAKVVHTNRRILAQLLGLPEQQVRLVELDVGGGFGGRGEFYPEDFLIPYCALRHKRPVAWTEDREENLRALNHSREQTHDVELALRSDGTFLALRDRFVMNTGAYVRTHGSVVPGMTAGLLPGPYIWGAYDCVAHQVVTNKTPAGTYRAPGRYEANFIRERVIDIAARRLGRDPADLRRQNLVAADRMPYEVGTHTDGHPVVFDSGDFPLLLDKGLDCFGYDEMLRWRSQDPGPGRRRGLGVGYFVEKSGIARWEYARVGLDSDGGTVVHVGSASVGQGVDTVLAQVCADTLGVPYDAITVRHGDTDVVPEGMGAFGSRASMLGGSAIARAAQRLRERLLQLAADKLEASAGDLTIEGDRVIVQGSPAKGVPLSELVAEARAGSALPRGEEPRLEEEAYFDCPDMSFPYGLHCVALEADVDTGAVEIHRYAVTYDIGRAINPMLVEGQIVGGVAQGLGGALLEEFAYDEFGQLVAGSFMDYLMPTAGEMPHVRVRITEDAPTPLNPLGVKGAGEGGTAAAGAVIANALSDALGSEARTLPLTPERVVELANAGSAA
jgi:aerobic carbon-monoxide dehydrogenase large subunit